MWDDINRTNQTSASRFDLSSVQRSHRDLQRQAIYKKRGPKQISVLFFVLSITQWWSL